MLVSLGVVPKFDPSCFILFTIGVYALCGWEPPTPICWSALIPAAILPSSATRLPRTPSLVPLPNRNAPCRALPTFLIRYFVLPSALRYVWGDRSLVAQSSCGGFTGNATGEQLWVTLTANAGRSGRPVAAPAWSLQVTSSSTLVANAIALPIIAKSC